MANAESWTKYLPWTKRDWAKINSLLDKIERNDPLIQDFLRKYEYTTNLHDLPPLQEGTCLVHISSSS